MPKNSLQEAQAAGFGPLAYPSRGFAMGARGGQQEIRAGERIHRPNLMKNSRRPEARSVVIGRPLALSGAAFSLVEVALAIGLVSFAFVALLGMIPTGLAAFSSAKDTISASQILQRVIGDAQQTDFDLLTENKTALFRKTPRYFDDQCNELPTASGAIYHVNTRIAPGALPQGSALSINSSLATVTIQIVNNPGNAVLALDETTSLWKPVGGALSSTFSTMVAKNK